MQSHTRHLRLRRVPLQTDNGDRQPILHSICQQSPPQHDSRVSLESSAVILTPAKNRLSIICGIAGFLNVGFSSPGAEVVGSLQIQGVWKSDSTKAGGRFPMHSVAYVLFPITRVLGIARCVVRSTPVCLISLELKLSRSDWFLVTARNTLPHMHRTAQERTS